MKVSTGTCKLSRKNRKKKWTTQRLAVIIQKFERCDTCLKGADGMANSVDPDQTAPSEAVLSGFILFAQICLSE